MHVLAIALDAALLAIHGEGSSTHALPGADAVQPDADRQAAWDAAIMSDDAFAAAYPGDGLDPLDASTDTCEDPFDMPEPSDADLDRASVSFDSDDPDSDCSTCGESTTNGFGQRIHCDCTWIPVHLDY